MVLPAGARAQAPALRLPPLADTTRLSGISVTGSGAGDIVARTINILAFVRGGNTKDADILAAMRAAGIDNPTISAGNSFVTANSPTQLRGTIHNATRERLDAIGRAAGAYVVTHPGTAIDSVQFLGVAADCSAVEERAREAAFAEAQRRAKAIAAIAGVVIGQPLSVNESGGCFSGNSGGTAVDAQTLEMHITVYEYVTFSIVRKP
jgi:Protein of unknown function (DUF541)